MSEKENKLTDKLKQSKLYEKLKNIKHLDLIIIIIFVCILLLIYFGDFSSTSKKSSTLSQTFTSYESYTKDLEKRLSGVLSKINGAGKVSVMITLNGSPELVIAYNTEEKNNLLNTDDSVTIKKEPIIINQNGVSSPLILSEIMPEIKGVVIVAQGANDVAVKLNLISATTKLLNININSIEIFAGN